MRDQSVNELYIHDKLTRETTWSLLRCVWAQIQLITDVPLSESTLPDTLLIDPLTNSRQVLTHTADGLVITEAGADTRPVFPADFTCRMFMTMVHIIDRASVGVTMMHFMLSKGYAWFLAFGVLHDIWNGVKAGAKDVCGGKWWRKILQFVSVCI